MRRETTSARPFSFAEHSCDVLDGDQSLLTHAFAQGPVWADTDLSGYERHLCCPDSHDSLAVEGGCEGPWGFEREDLWLRLGIGSADWRGPFCREANNSAAVNTMRRASCVRASRRKAWTGGSPDITRF